MRDNAAIAELLTNMERWRRNGRGHTAAAIERRYKFIQLSFMELNLAAAVLAKIPADRIINFMSVDQIKRWAQTERASSSPELTRPPRSSRARTFAKV